MSGTFNRTVATAALMIGLLGGAAQASEPTGTWLRDNGESRVRIAKCGAAFCGTVSWLKSPETSKSKVGQRVFFDMMPDGAGKWAGKAFNPEDGQTYAGKMTLSGTTLTTAGCVAGGFICRSVNWKKMD